MTQDFTLAFPGRLFGIVTDAVTGTPIAGTTATAGRNQMTTGASGLFDMFMTDLRPGTSVPVTAIAPNYPSASIAIAVP